MIEEGPGALENLCFRASVNSWRVGQRMEEANYAVICSCKLVVVSKMVQTKQLPIWTINVLLDI